MSDRRPVICVAIVTFRRSKGLQRLLVCLKRQALLNEAFALHAVVVDNDAAGSARPVCNGHEHDGFYTLSYVHEPEQGIPIARNAALAAVPDGADFICFIDDDEWPCDSWLAAFVTFLRNSPADCLYGPVAPVYAKTGKQWFVKARVFARRRFRNGDRLSFAATNNVLVSTAFIKRHELRFDTRMRFTGGSDYLFFRQAIDRGLEVRWCEDALVYDEIPENRMTWAWVAQRQFRLGNTFGIAERLIGTPFTKAKRAVIGLTRIGFGFVLVPLLAVSPYYGMRGLTHFLRGCGTIAGLLGHSHQEYAPRNPGRAGQ